LSLRQVVELSDAPNNGVGVMHHFLLRLVITQAWFAGTNGLGIETTKARISISVLIVSLLVIILSPLILQNKRNI